jgi:hypothetical protein
MEIDWYEVYFLRTAYPHPPAVQSVFTSYRTPLSLDGGKSMTRAIGRVGPENQNNLEINI